MLDLNSIEKINSAARPIDEYITHLATENNKFTIINHIDAKSPEEAIKTAMEKDALAKKAKIKNVKATQLFERSIGLALRLANGDDDSICELSIKGSNPKILEVFAEALVEAFGGTPCFDEYKQTNATLEDFTEDEDFEVTGF